MQIIYKQTIAYRNFIYYRAVIADWGKIREHSTNDAVTRGYLYGKTEVGFLPYSTTEK